VLDDTAAGWSRASRPIIRGLKQRMGNPVELLILAAYVRSDMPRSSGLQNSILRACAVPWVLPFFAEASCRQESALDGQATSWRGLFDSLGHWCRHFVFTQVHNRTSGMVNLRPTIVHVSIGSAWLSHFGQIIVSSCCVRTSVARLIPSREGENWEYSQFLTGNIPSL